MYQVKFVAVSVLILMAFMVAGSMTHSQAQTTEQQGTSTDNTKMNAQDRDKASPTADQVMSLDVLADHNPAVARICPSIQ